MKPAKNFFSLTLCAMTLMFAQVAHAAGEFKGSWTIMPSETAGQIRFGLMHHLHGGNSQHESDWPTSAFQGLDLAASSRHDVKFTIARDAGRFDCEGFLDNGEGAGVFHFAPDGKYAGAMGALGFTGIDEEKQFAMAVHDVSLDFARQMKSEKVSGLNTDKLIAFRIFNVSHPFIQELRAEGLAATDSDKLVAFRIHGVTPAMIRATHQAGLKPSEDQLVAMRIHGVTPEFITDLKSRGMQNLTIDQLVSLRIHGID